MKAFWKIGVAAVALALGPLPHAALWAAAPGVSADAAAQEARLTTFLDAEFAQELTMRPQLATRLGVKDGQDRLDDNSDAGALKLLEWRRGSVARM